MTKIIGRIFSDKYVKSASVVDNIVMLLLYRFAYPFAFLFNKLNISPNQITTQSTVFSILAFFSLIYDEGWVYFSVFWGVSYLLDLCDGTVARMSDKVSKSAFRYDHMSDLFKISLVLMGVGLRYNDKLIWMLAFSASFGLMYVDILNHTLSYSAKHVAQTQQPLSDGENSLLSNSRMRDRYRIVFWVVKHDLLYKITKMFLALLTIDGHILLLFFLFPFGLKASMWCLGYLIFIEFLAIRSRMTSLIILRRH
jgi:hypothetical protein